MTTGPEELSLNYLLDPAFQLVNTAGRPLTNGWIEVYYHGTRDKYYCASDFDGTLHPFKIPLDSLGSNIVLADPNFSYDIYVYNSFGSLQMSRYNVNPGSGSGGGSSSEGGPAEHWSSDTAGGASTTVTGGTTVYLTLPSSEDQPEFVDHTTETAIFLKEGLYHIDAVVSFKQDEDDLQNIIKDLVVNTGLIGWDAQMTGQKNWTGPESTDDDRHFLELHTVVSVPEDSLQTLYFQISSPVDLDSAAIEKLDIVKLTAGGGGMTYAAGYGIDITGQVISTSGMMPESSAANFVDVSTYSTDIENIYETIAETSAMIPSGVATEQYVQDYTSAFITEDALDGYATQQWVEDQHYITSADIPPIPQDVVTSGELATVSGDIVSQIPSLDGYATQNWVQDQGYLTSVPEEYVTQTEMENYTSAFITSADVPHFTQEQADWNEDDQSAPDYIKNKPTIPSIEGLASEQYVQDYTSAFITSADIPDVPADVVTSGQLATVSGEIVNQIPDVSDMATQTWVNEQGFITSLPEDLVTSGELATVSGDIMNEMPDTSDMATKTWVGQQGYLTSIPAEYATSGDLVTLSGAIEADIPSYTAGDNISIVNDEISVSGTTGLIAGDNISITASGDNYVISSTGGGGGGSDVFYAIIGTTTFNAVWNAVTSGKVVYAVPSGEDPTAVGIDGSEIYRLVEIFNTEGSSAVFERVKGDGPEFSVTFVTLDQEDTWNTSSSIGSLVPSVSWTEGDVLTADGEGGMTWAPPAGGGGGLDQVYHDAGLTGSGTSASPLSITSASNWSQAYDAINASASSWNDAAGMNEYPISAGPGMSIEDVNGVTVFQTSGTMMDDLIEYNSQDEISGYNGHPVMTVESEKQWLTHDDTIAHVTNSAQYAFGVNVPVVAQAMGTDETELWSGTRTSACTLSEDPTNFKAIEIYLDLGISTRPHPILKMVPNTEMRALFAKGGNNVWWTWMSLVVDGTSLSVVHTKAFNFGSATSTTWANPSVSVDVDEDHNSIVKVVGIGRKETT